MFQSLAIHNFRQLRSIQIDSLKRINLIVGKNNSGKTALLEALFLLLAKDAELGNFAGAFRCTHGNPTDDFESFWQWLPYQKDLKSPLRISAVTTQNDEYTVELISNSSTERLAFAYNDSHSQLGSLIVQKGKYIGGQTPLDWRQVSVFSTRPSSPAEDAEQFNRIAAKRGGRQKLTELLQKVEPKLHELQYLKLGTQPLVYADVGINDLIPITQLGQGFVRLLRIFVEALLSESKVILIDEIENGIGYRAQVDLWKGLAEHAHQEDIQIFATTHSYECIQAAHELFAANDQYDFALHRLERTTQDNVRVITYDQKTLDTAIELNLEVR